MKEFREDVVRVARNRERGVTLEQIAAGFGVHPIMLSTWLRRHRRGRQRRLDRLSPVEFEIIVTPPPASAA
ncbi:hypothetical protein ABZ172_03955 [Streptomyces sp. NPDC006296]|uniref:hypothetical protein n=1 Tax=Streptomyces sp. NPDC006296 TaxID=3156746 RepID=UPI0033AC7005